MHSLLSLIFGVTFTPSVSTAILLSADAAALIAVPSVLMRRAGRPLASISWVLALLALPFVGVLSWLLLGRGYLRRQRNSCRKSRAILCARCPPPAMEEHPLPPRVQQIAPFAIASRRWTDGAFPPRTAARARVLCDGRVAFPAMRASIDDAKSEVLALFYIWQADETGADIARRLAARARAGTRVRVLVDSVGSSVFMRRHAPQLRAAGAYVAAFLPARFRPWSPTFNFRNHRKLLVVDGLVAYTGGMNVGDEYAERWHDLAVEVRGAVVGQLRDVFVEDWHFATGEVLAQVEHQYSEVRGDEVCGDEVGSDAPVCVVLASGPDRDENRVHDAFFLAITAATRRVWLTTPYFIPSPAISAALRGAALRGVDVRLLLPGRGDLRIVELASKSYYEELLRAGVKLFEYQLATLHAKSLVVDDDVVIMGSANTDIRSFRFNFELVCLFFSPVMALELERVFEADLQHSRVVGLESVLTRPSHRVLLEATAHLMSPLL